jgi:transcription elongation factor GreA
MAAEAFRSRIGSALANRDFAEVEAAWREYASLHPEDHEYLVGAAGQLLRFDKGALAGEMLLSLAQTLLERGDAGAAFEAARASLRASQRTAGLRELLIAAYKAKHAKNPHLKTFLEKTGIATEGGSLRAQIEALDRYLTFAEGAYVFHRGGWGYGVVAEFDPGEESMVVDFQRKPGHQIGIQNATKILERLPDEHIGVYKHYRRDELTRMMETEPAKVFRIFLASHGGKTTLKQVREEFVPDLLQKNDWSKWWTRAKKALLADPEIRVGKGSTPPLELRDRARTVEQEVVERMQARADVKEKISAAREYLRSLDLTPAMAAAIGGETDAALRTAEAPADRLALLYLKADLKGEGGAAAAEEAKRLLLELPDLVPLFRALEPGDRKRAAQDLIGSGAPDATERVAKVLRAGDAEAADSILEHLKAHRPDILIDFFAQLSTNPRENPELFLTYTRGILNGTIPGELISGEKESAAVEKLLTLADQIGLEVKRTGDARLKEFLRHVRSFFTSRRLKMFQDFVTKSSPDYARYLFAKIQRNRGFTDQTRQALQEVIEAHLPDIRTGPAEAAEAAAAAEIGHESDVIYTTLHGYRRRERELKHILDVEVPRNAEDLGRAASFGDISENAEYSAALEKQEHLMRRIKELRDDLDKARILDPDKVTAERVVVGTRVRLSNLTKGGEETYALLGPWDTDLERGVISYLSPVGRGLLGKGRGAKADIVLPEGAVSYEIMDIEAAPPELLEAEQ